jgi:hypothetical protein
MNCLLNLWQNYAFDLFYGMPRFLFLPFGFQILDLFRQISIIFFAAPLIFPSFSIS